MPNLPAAVTVRKLYDQVVVSLSDVPPGMSENDLVAVGAQGGSLGVGNANNGVYKVKPGAWEKQTPNFSGPRHQILVSGFDGTDLSGLWHLIRTDNITGACRFGRGSG